MDKRVVCGTRSSKQRLVMRSEWDKDKLSGCMQYLIKGESNCEQPMYLTRTLSHGIISSLFVMCVQCCIVRSARIMRSQLMMSPSWPKQRLQLEKTCAHLDEHLITVLDRAGARFALRQDAGLFHQVSEKFFCTSELLDLCVAAILHPTATSTRKILGYIADHMGDTSFMLPAATGEVLLTLLEHISAHPSIVSLMRRARESVANGPFAIGSSHA